MIKKYIFLIFTLCIHHITYSQSIFLDESFDDWSNGVTSFIDQTGDGGSAGIDFTNIKISNDETFLFVYIDIKKELNLQADNSITIYIDFDNNQSTGLMVNGIGADLSYSFGDRRGRYYFSNGSTQVFHDEIGLITLPTVTSSKFEIGILRKPSSTMQMGNTIRVVLSDGSDLAPNAGSYAYSFTNNGSSIRPFSLQKSSPLDIRFLTYNVLKDNIFEPSLLPAYKRIFSAIKPDVIGFCEIYDKTANATKNYIESFISSTPGETWYTDDASPDIRLVSKYPVLQSTRLDGNGVFLLNVKGRKILYIVIHLPCCDNDLDRQKEVDKVMAFVRDVRFGISSFDVPPGTPIIISGDTNLVGLREQQQSLITGNIINNGLFGPDFKPDWDNSDLLDAKPATTNMPATITWFSEFGSYSAGRLDYFLFTDSAIKLKNSFVLFSNAMSPIQLSASGLLKNDILDASDHMPVVADFSFDLSSSITDVNINSQNVTWRIVDKKLLVDMPDASNMSVKVMMTNMQGQKLYAQSTIIGNELTIDVSELLSHQIYLVQLLSDGKVDSFSFYNH